MLSSVLGEAFGIFRDWVEGRRRISQARTEAQIAVEQARVTAEVDWDQIMARGSTNSWKDEYWTLIFGFPLILGFFPSFRDDALSYISFIEGMPDWYVGLIGALVGASIGIRKLSDLWSRVRRPDTTTNP